MKLLIFDDLHVILMWTVDSWHITRVFRRHPGLIQAEEVSVSVLPWTIRVSIAEYCDNSLP